MNNPTVLKLFAGLSFIISAIFTIMLMTSQAIGIIPTLLMVTVAIIMEFAKCFFLYKSLNSYHLPLAIRVVTVTISAVLFLSSIVASLAFMYNQNNTSRNIQIKTSTEYTQQQENRQTKQVVFAQKQAEIEQLRQQAAELPKNYYSLKQGVMSTISAKQKELQGISQDLESASRTTVKFTLDDKGYTAFLKVIADKTGKTTEELEVLLFTIMAVIFEFVAVFLFYIQQTEQSETLTDTIPTEYPRRTSKFKPKQVPAIGFKHDGIRSEDLKRYVKYMNDNAKGDVSPGYRNIGDGIGLDAESARKIKGYLERTGAISTCGNRTIISRAQS